MGAEATKGASGLEPDAYFVWMWGRKTLSIQEDATCTEPVFGTAFGKSVEIYCHEEMQVFGHA